MPQGDFPPRELALLPPYCKYAGGFPEHNNAAQVAKWRAIIGGTFEHIHHYCVGLMDVNHANLFSRSAQERLHTLSASVGEFQYVIDRAPPDFVLLPEIHTKRGESFVALNKGELAIPEFRRAIELKPDYWPPYADLSDYYKESGNLGLAREWVEKGLAIMPNAEALTRRLAELDAIAGKRGGNGSAARGAAGTAGAPDDQRVQGEQAGSNEAVACRLARGASAIPCLWTTARVGLRQGVHCKRR